MTFACKSLTNETTGLLSSHIPFFFNFPPPSLSFFLSLSWFDTLLGPTGMASPYPYMGGAPAAMSGQTAAPSERVILHVQNRMVGAIIGRSGSYIRQVMEQSGAHIRINSDPADEGGDDTIRQCIVSGKPEAQFQAQQMIYKKLQEQEGIAQGATRAPAIPFSIEVEMPEACIGRLIGKGGARIRQISDVSNAQLTVGVRCARGLGQSICVACGASWAPMGTPGHTEASDVRFNLLILPALSSPHANRSIVRRKRAARRRQPWASWAALVTSPSRSTSSAALSSSTT